MHGCATGEFARAHHQPAGHVACVYASGDTDPVAQKYPGAHMPPHEGDAYVADKPPCVPAGHGWGAVLPAAQNLPYPHVPPLGCPVLLMDPAGHQYPPLHNPVHELLVSPTAEP